MEGAHISNNLDSFCEQLSNSYHISSYEDSSEDNNSEFEKALSQLEHCFVKIKLTEGKPLIWKAQEWLKLQENRIHGTLIGIPANFPKQVSENGLPLLLLPEEVTLIIEKNLGKVYNYKKERLLPDEKVKKEYNDYLKINKEQQDEYYKKICREQVLERIDVIIEGKKRKRLTMKQKTDETVEEPELDREALIEIEVDRKLKAATAVDLIQIPTASPWLTDDDLEPVEWNFPETSKEKLRYRIFKDLYEKGYSLTSSSKFGGDFLVYPGEPWMFHAYYIVICLEFDEEFQLTELVSNARVGVFTRKNLVIASIDNNDQIFYNTLTWPAKESN